MDKKTQKKLGVSRKDIYLIPLGLIDADPKTNCRENMDDVEIKSLALNMEAEGQHTPILVREQGERYTLVAGFRRLAAAKLLNWERVEAKRYTESSEHAQVTNLTENLQRRDLSPLEIARGLQLSVTKGLTEEEIAERVGRTVKWVKKYLDLLLLNKKEQALLRNHALSATAACEIVNLDDEERTEILELAKRLSGGKTMTLHGVRRAKQKRKLSSSNVAPTKKEIGAYLDSLRRNTSAEAKYATDVLAWVLGQRPSRPRLPQKGMLVAKRSASRKSK